MPAGAARDALPPSLSQLLHDQRTCRPAPQSAGANLSREQAGGIMAVDGERVPREINKIRNAFNVEFAQSVLRTTVQLSDFVGGADNVTAAFRSLGPAAIGAGGLGELIFRGLAMVNNAVILAGAIPAALMALAADTLLGWLEKRLSPQRAA